MPEIIWPTDLFITKWDQLPSNSVQSLLLTGSFKKMGDSILKLLPKSARRNARNPKTENASLQPDEKVLPVVKLLGVLESIVGWCLSSVMDLLFFTCSSKM